MEKKFYDIFPLSCIEHDVIVSAIGDITVAFKATLPELFTLSENDYEALHQVFIKAIKVLPDNSIIHKQDWFLESEYKANFGLTQDSFLSRSSERFFNERPYLDHDCFIMITKKPSGRKAATSLFSNLLRRSIVPEQTIKQHLVQDFLDTAAQFERIINDSGHIMLSRLKELDLTGDEKNTGLIERYCTLQPQANMRLVRDMRFKNEMRIGDDYCQLYTLADAQDLPGYCGSRINYDRYSTDKTKFSIGFASSLGQLLSCNHLYNQYIFIDDQKKVIKKLESKRLRLQSLSAYSRENAIGRDATNDFLNEALSSQRLPVKAHFNVLVWNNEKTN